MLLASVLSGLSASGRIHEWTGFDVLEVFGPDDYAMQLFGVVFGFLSVTRLNMSYQRYWEGISKIKDMYSKWGDACVQAIAFDRVYSHASGCGDDDFCSHVVRLFCQLSAMARRSELRLPAWPLHPVQRPIILHPRTICNKLGARPRTPERRPSS